MKNLLKFALALFVFCALANAPFAQEAKSALSDLKRAIELDASNKEYAKQSKAFKNLWNDEDFKKLVN